MSRKDFKILFEAARVIAVFKPQKTHTDSLRIVRDALVYLPVHRIDFETQGLVLLAREDSWPAYHALFREQRARKIYLGGAAPNAALLGHHRGFVGSRYRSSKKTRYAVDEKTFQGFHSVQAAEHSVVRSVASAPFRGTVYEIDLLSGCRHQIRSFFAVSGSPLIGDALYGDTSGQKTLELVSWKLAFTDPFTETPFSLAVPLELISMEHE